MQAMKIAFDAFGKNLDGAGLGQSRCPFHQQVAIAKQCNQHPVYQLRLTNDQIARVSFELLELFYQAHLVLRQGDIYMFSES